MASSSRARISRKARAKAEADFVTWLMMAKLGGGLPLSGDRLSPRGAARRMIGN